jgi:hypothetical protein
LPLIAIAAAHHNAFAAVSYAAGVEIIIANTVHNMSTRPRIEGMHQRFGQQNHRCRASAPLRLGK